MQKATLLRTSLVVGALLVLEVACRIGWFKATTIVAPSAMARRLLQLGAQPAFWQEISTTLHNVLWAFAIAVVVGVSCALLLYRLSRLRRAIEPMIASYYALPFFAFYPLAIVLFGMNDFPIIVMGALFGLVAMISGTLDGFDRIPRVLVKAGSSFQLGPGRTALMIQIPAALPYVFSGAKLALGYSISGVIGSEFILSGSGLGYSIAFAYNNFDTSTMYALLMFLILVVSAILIVLGVLERRLQYRAGSSWTVVVQKELRFTFDHLIAIFAVGVGAVMSWQLLYNFAGSEAIASPEMTADRIVELMRTDRFWEHARETGKALGISLLVAVACGTIVGVALGAYRLAGQVFEPMLVALQATPKVTLYPVMLLVFGLGLAAKVAFGAIHGVIPMAFLTMAAIRNINPTLIRTARAFRLDKLQTVTTVLFPAVLPEAVTAMRLSFSITFLGVLIGEMFASQRGLGFLLMSSIGLNDVATIMSVTVLLAAVAIAINSCLLVLDAHVSR